MIQVVSEADWKLFRGRISEWQERFMDKLIKDYSDLLTDPSKLSSDKFWILEERINLDKKFKGVKCEMSRSTIFNNLINLYIEGAITDEDLEGFDEELIKSVKAAGF